MRKKKTNTISELTPKLKVPKINFDVGNYKGSVKCNKKSCSVKAKKKGFFEGLFG